MIGHEESIIKKIEIEQKFSDIVFKSFRQERFGITHCCPIDIEKLAIKKELCDWQEIKTPVYISKKYVEEIWIPGGSIPRPIWAASSCGENEGGDCIENVTCIYIEVINQNGTPIEDYPIYIDGGNVGETNEKGILHTSILHTNKSLSHTLDLCYCFATTGQCSQIKFVVTVTEECPPEACEAPTIKCEDEPLPPYCDPTSGPVDWQPADLCTSIHQAFWFFEDVQIDGITAGSGDWIGAFSPSTGALVGLAEVIFAGLPLGVTIVIHGVDGGAPCTADYITLGEIPVFKLYRGKTCEYCENAIPSQEEPWAPATFHPMDLLTCSLDI